MAKAYLSGRKFTRHQQKVVDAVFERIASEDAQDAKDAEDSQNTQKSTTTTDTVIGGA